MLTKPELLMYWMKFGSRYESYLTEDDRDILVNDHCLFKDRKSISNALHILKKNGYAVKTNASSWVLTSAGISHLINAIKRENNAESQQCSSKPEDEIAKLEEENMKLKEENEKLKADNKALDESVKSLLATVDFWEKTYKQLSGQIDKLRSENEALHQQYDPLEQSIEAFTAGAKIFSDIAKRFS